MILYESHAEHTTLERHDAAKDKTTLTGNSPWREWRDEQDYFLREGDQPAVVIADGAKEWWVDGSA